jgi:hypothetical protein
MNMLKGLADKVTHKDSSANANTNTNANDKGFAGRWLLCSQLMPDPRDFLDQGVGYLGGAAGHNLNREQVSRVDIARDVI